MYDEDEEVKMINSWNANSSALFKNSQLDESDWWFFNDQEWVETEEGTTLWKKRKVVESFKNGKTSVSKIESQIFVSSGKEFEVKKALKNAWSR